MHKYDRDEEDQSDLEQTVSLPSSVTGISNTIFLMPKCIKVAIDPPNSPDPRKTNVGVNNRGTTFGDIDRALQ